jgi:thiol:disulfide interchange protein
MRALNGLLMTICLVLGLTAAAGRAGAQAPFGAGGTPHIAASLVAESSRPAPGSKVTMALFMQPEKGWHGYWDNPGDAGLGLTIDWDLPGGATASPLRYPVPRRLLISGLMNHVYETDYALLFDLTVPSDARPGTTLAVRGQARWLACTDSSCVPEQGRVETVLTVGDGTIAAADRARFDRWRAQMPRPLDQPARYAVSGTRIAIAVPYPAGAPVGEPWFFAQTQGRIQYAQAQKVRRVDDMLVVEAAASEGAAAGGPIDGVLSITPAIALQISATPGTVPEGGMTVGASRTQNAATSFAPGTFLLALGGAMLGGLILNVMPCVFPILSLKAISLARAGESEAKARREALAYTGGILLTCLALGGLMLAIRAAGTEVGWAFQLQQPAVVALLLVLMVAVTLNLAGLFEIGTVSVGQDRAGQGGLAGAFWTGALAAFVATPCLGPFLGAAMGAALVLPWPLALAVFAGLGLGLASPFLAIAYLPGLRKMLPRPGMWMTRFRAIMAVPMGLTALALLWLLSRQLGTGGIALGIMLAMVTGFALGGLGRLQRAGLAMSPLRAGLSILVLGVAAVGGPTLFGSDRVQAGAGLAGTPFSAQALAAARASGRPVFLYFTADWCLTCKVNEASAIDRAEVRAAFARAGVETMVGDWTSADPAITRFLESQGRSGVPLYLYYPKGAAEPQLLPQVLTPGTLTDLVQS